MLGPPSKQTLGVFRTLDEVWVMPHRSIWLQEVDLSASIRLALDELELGDLTLCPAVRPWLGYGGVDSCVVTYDAVGERCDETSASGRDPRREIIGKLLADHGMETGHEVACSRQHGQARLDGGNNHSVGFAQMIGSC